MQDLCGDNMVMREKLIGLIGTVCVSPRSIVVYMSFQDLEAFNLALLEKQGWKLFHNHESLFYQVFKAK